MSEPRVGVGVGGYLEIRAQTFEELEIPGKRDQGVAILMIETRQGSDQVADIRADSEVTNAANIDRDVERHV